MPTTTPHFTVLSIYNNIIIIKPKQTHHCSQKHPPPFCFLGHSRSQSSHLDFPPPSHHTRILIPFSHNLVRSSAHLFWVLVHFSPSHLYCYFNSLDSFFLFFLFFLNLCCPYGSEVKGFKFEDQYCFLSLLV